MIHREPPAILIKNLRLRTVIGINDWERREKQDVIINVRLQMQPGTEVTNDRIERTINYRSLTKAIIQEVEQSNFFLLEKLCERILEIVMGDSRVWRAEVELDKPQALRFTDSVAVRCAAERRP